MGVNTAGALLEIFGGGAEGVGGSMKENAILEMREEAVKLRDAHLSQLQNQNAIAAHGRTLDRDEKIHERGLLEKEKEREYSSPTKAAGREIEALVSLGMTEQQAQQSVKTTLTATKGDKSLDRVKAFGKLKADFIKVLTPEGMDATPEIMQQAHEKTVEAFQMFGETVGTPEKAEPEETTDDELTLDALRAEIEAAGKKDKPDETAVADTDIDMPPGEVEEEEEDDDQFGAGIPAMGEAVTSSVKGIGKKLSKWGEKQRARFEPGGRLSGQPGGLLEGDKPTKKKPPAKPKKTPLLNPLAPESAVAAPAEGEMEQVETKYNGNPVYKRGDEYFVLEKGKLRKLEAWEVEELIQVMGNKPAKQ